METLVSLKLEVVNSFEFPKENELLGQELAACSSRLEEDPEYTEEDEFIVAGFEGDFVGVLESEKWYDSVLKALSEDFPNLIFALDFYDHDKYDDGPPIGLLRRWYFRAGKKQVVEPHMVIPDFDTELAS